MSTSTPSQRRILAVRPASRRFGFVVLESPTTVIDWGIRQTRTDKNNRTLAAVSKLLDHYAPDLLVIEDVAAGGSNRPPQVMELLNQLKSVATVKGIHVRAISRKLVQTVFATFRAQTREEIACVIADQLPELAPQLPPHRKAYMSDGYWMATFDAASLALTYYYSRPIRHFKDPASEGT